MIKAVWYSPGSATYDGNKAHLLSHKCHALRVGSLKGGVDGEEEVVGGEAIGNHREGNQNTGRAPIQKRTCISSGYCGFGLLVTSVSLPTSGSSAPPLLHPSGKTMWGMTQIGAGEVETIDVPRREVSSRSILHPFRMPC